MYVIIITNMILSINLSDYSISNIHLCESISNTVITNGNFTRILYSQEHFTMNGIHLNIIFDKCNIECMNNKYRCIIDNKKNISVINKIIEIENNILNLVNNTSKNKVYNLTQQLNTGFIRLFIEKDILNTKGNNCFILKIAGIWEDAENYGITYKFILTNHL